MSSAKTAAADSIIFDSLTPLPVSPQVTMAYVPFQTDKEMYDEGEALSRGSLFKVLDKPFCRGCLK